MPRIICLGCFISAMSAIAYTQSAEDQIAVALLAAPPAMQGEAMAIRLWMPTGTTRSCETARMGWSVGIARMSPNGRSVSNAPARVPGKPGQGGQDAVM